MLCVKKNPLVVLSKCGAVVTIKSCLLISQETSCSALIYYPLALSQSDECLAQTWPTCVVFYGPRLAFADSVESGWGLAQQQAHIIWPRCQICSDLWVLDRETEVAQSHCLGCVWRVAVHLILGNTKSDKLFSFQMLKLVLLLWLLVILSHILLLTLYTTACNCKTNIKNKVFEYKQTLNNRTSIMHINETLIKYRWK